MLEVVGAAMEALSSCSPVLETVGALSSVGDESSAPCLS